MNSTSQPKLRAPKRRKWRLRAAVLLLLALILGVAAWCRWVYVQVERRAVIDQAAPSDAIVVFGAAEYDGRPSPVFRARLDHARILYERGTAPLIVTLGGSEGGVNRGDRDKRKGRCALPRRARP